MNPATATPLSQKETFAQDLGRVVWGIASTVALGMAATCARPAPPPERPAPGPSRIITPRANGGEVGSTSRPPVIEAVAAQVDVEAAPRSGPLARFQRRMELLASEDAGRVRIAWFGDSHTAADYWSGTVRRRLQARSGNGGPGFVHVGLSGYPNSMVRVETAGQWRGEPRAPSSRTLQHDGVFGLSGMRVHAEAGARAWLRIVDPPAVDVKWSLVIRFLDAGARLSLELGKEHRTLGRVDANEGDSLRTETISGPADAALAISVDRGRVEIFGATGEYDLPGIVLDAFGINGARAETVLAWSEEPWEEQLGSRAPALVVLAYGTNEVFDALKPERYEAHFTEIMRRVRTAVEDADCLLVGPTDVARGGAEGDQRAEAIDRVESAVAGRLGCAYFSTFQAMGGPAGFESWRTSDPQLAGPDGVHLTRAGYAVLGDKLADLLLSE